MSTHEGSLRSEVLSTLSQGNKIWEELFGGRSLSSTSQAAPEDSGAFSSGSSFRRGRFLLEYSVHSAVMENLGRDLKHGPLGDGGGKYPCSGLCCMRHSLWLIQQKGNCPAGQPPMVRPGIRGSHTAAGTGRWQLCPPHASPNPARGSVPPSCGLGPDPERLVQSKLSSASTLAARDAGSKWCFLAYRLGGGFVSLQDVSQGEVIHSLGRAHLLGTTMRDQSPCSQLRRKGPHQLRGMSMGLDSGNSIASLVSQAISSLWGFH